jgi:hypothetical protein
LSSAKARMAKADRGDQLAPIALHLGVSTGPTCHEDDGKSASGGQRAPRSSGVARHRRARWRPTMRTPSAMAGSIMPGPAAERRRKRGPASVPQGRRCLAECGLWRQPRRSDRPPRRRCALHADARVEETGATVGQIRPARSPPGCAPARQGRGWRTRARRGGERRRLRVAWAARAPTPGKRRGPARRMVVEPTHQRRAAHLRSGRNDARSGSGRPTGTRATRTAVIPPTR